MGKHCGMLCGLLVSWVGGMLCFPMQPEVPKDLPSHNRTLRELSCNKGEYPYEDRCCQNCPAGSYVVNHCTEDHQRSLCDSCTLGRDFTVSASGIEQCVSCLVCRQDQAQVQPCNLTSNAVCECKPGTYCTGMCEICIPCSRCGKGKRVKEPCSDTKNTVCEDIPPTQPTSNTTSTYLLPPTSTSGMTTAPKKDVTKRINSTQEKDVTKDPDGPKSETDSYFTPFIVLLIIVPLLCVALGGWCLYIFCRREKQNPSNNQNLLANNSADPSTNSSLTSLPLEDRANRGVAGPRMEAQPLLNSSNVCNRVTEPTEHPNARGPQSDQDPGGDDRGGGGRGAANSNEPCSICEQLPPCDCYWTSCFHCVFDVCPEHIVRIVRELRVPNNKIECIIKDNPQDTYERSYKLLQLWRTMVGKEASMHKVIGVLIDMEMKGLAENIRNSLTYKNITIV